MPGLGHGPQVGRIGADTNVVQHIDDDLAAGLLGDGDRVERPAGVGPGHVLQRDADAVAVRHFDKCGQTGHRVGADRQASETTSNAAAPTADARSTSGPGSSSDPMR